MDQSHRLCEGRSLEGPRIGAFHTASIPLNDEMPGILETRGPPAFSAELGHWSSAICNNICSSCLMVQNFR